MSKVNKNATEHEFVTPDESLQQRVMKPSFMQN